MNNSWQFTANPKEKGWFAVLICYEPCEGTFPGAAYWDGNNWSEAFVVGYSSNHFDDEHQAKKWADDNDPDNKIIGASK